MSPSLTRAVVVVALLAASATTGCMVGFDGEHLVTLDVRFRLTDLDYKPIPRQDVRIVLGPSGDWQAAAAGQRFTTDGSGEHRYRTHTALEKVSRKRPTNFVDSLLSRPQPADHLQLGAELEYLGHRWLYVTHAYRFADGDVLQDGFAIYTRDAQGRFTHKADASDTGWRIADLGGLVLTAPGHEVWNLMLKPDERDPMHWTLDVAFKRAPPPVVR
jgi:hypothetical protein